MEKVSTSEFAQDIGCWINRCNEAAVLDIVPTSQTEMLSLITQDKKQRSMLIRNRRFQRRKAQNLQLFEYGTLVRMLGDMRRNVKGHQKQRVSVTLNFS